MFKKFTAAFVLFAFMTGIAQAAALRDRDEAKAMVDVAVAFHASHGIEALVEAVHDPENADFHDGELYIFIYDFNGVNVALGSNPAFVGRDLYDLQDQNGVMIIQEMIKLTQNGESGWVDYHWPNPETKQIQAKSSFVTALEGKYFVGVGIYE